MSSKTYELAIKIAGKIDPSVKRAISGASGELGHLAKIGAAAMAATVTGAVAVSKKMYDVAASFDAAYDAVRIGTGATGQALAALNQSVNAVYGGVPTTLENCGTAIANFNTLLGVNGGTLETLSIQAIQVSNMLGEELPGVIENSSHALSQWNIATSQMGTSMDYAFKVSQSTGVGFTELMEQMQLYGAALQQYGYGFDEAAVMLGNLEKAGFDSAQVFAALKSGAPKLAIEGFDTLGEGMAAYSAQIQAAATETEALSIASRVFGSRGATTMVAAIRSGAFSVEELQAALTASSETINAAALDTYDFAERWQLMRQQLEIAVQPGAMEFFNTLGDRMPQIAEALSALLPVLGNVAGAAAALIVKLVDFGSWAVQNWPALVTLITSLGAAFAAIKITALIKGAGSLSGVLGKIGKVIAANKIGLIIAAIGVVVSAIVYLWNNCEGFRNFVINAWAAIKTAASVAVAWFSENILPGILAVWDNIKAVFGGVVDFITGVFTGNWSLAWEGVVSVFGGIIGTLTEIFKAPINGCIKLLNWFIGKINGISIGPLPNWGILGEYAGATVGFNVAQIEYLAQGGIVTRPTMAMIGEGGEPEAVTPLSKLTEMLGGPGGATYVFSPNVSFPPGTSLEEADEMMDELYAKFVAFMERYKRQQRRVAF